MNVNRQPEGLLGFLGIKNGGRNPQALGDVIAPTWAATEMYLSPPSLWDANSGTETSTGGVITHTVPDGKVWYVHGYSVRFTTPAGDAISATACMIPSSAAATIFVAMGDTLTLVAGAIAQGGHTSFNRPQWLFSGDSVGYTCDYILTAVSVPWNAYIRYTELDR